MSENETKHTPEPWHVHTATYPGQDVSVYARTPVHHNPRSVARVYGSGAVSAHANYAERDANAALIAAAPALLEALEMLHDLCAGRELFPLACESAIAAILAARGGAR